MEVLLELGTDFYALRLGDQFDFFRFENLNDYFQSLEAQSEKLDNATCFIHSAHFTVLPSHLKISIDHTELLKKSCGAIIDPVLVCENTFVQQKIVFDVHTKLIDILPKAGAGFQHILSPLISLAVKRKSSQIYLQKDAFWLVIFNEGKVLFQNYFQIESQADFLYFLGASLQECGLEQTQELFCINNSNKLTPEEVMVYFPNLEFQNVKSILECV